MLRVRAVCFACAAGLIAEMLTSTLVGQSNAQGVSHGVSFYSVDISPGMQTIGVYAPSINPPPPVSNWLFGNPPQSGVMGEVAIAQQVLSVGDYVPLPTYADGTQATDGEVFWTAHLWLASWTGSLWPFDDRYLPGDGSGAAFQGRQLVAAAFVTGVSVSNPARCEVQGGCSQG